MIDNLDSRTKYPELLIKAANALKSYNQRPIQIMEVCGTHTNCIFKFGIRSLLPDRIKVLSGPGCPVCVTPASFIDLGIDLARSGKDTIIATFGDMIRVPGSNSSLAEQSPITKNISIVYSPFDALNIAINNPNKKVIFLSVGFETTAPVIALTIMKAKSIGVKNFFVLTANKTIPEILETLASDKSSKIDAYIYPGNVSAIIGTSVYDHISSKHHIPGVITGFDPEDILLAILMLAKNIINKNYISYNLYSRAVPPEGNKIAKDKMYQVFEKCDSYWRGIGVVRNSGLRINLAYQEFDAYKVFDLQNKLTLDSDSTMCICGDILKGLKAPTGCSMFAKTCTPDSPMGACMVSSEGTCAAYYKYGKKF